ncbi:DUF4197 domain-containing protein [Myroides sp. LJL110]
MNKKLHSILLICALSLTPKLSLQIQAQDNSKNAINLLSQDKVSQGLKEALYNGITQQVSKLTQKDGFYKNELAKILLPEQVQKVDQALRKAGLGQLADQGIIILNRAAENAVQGATPIFVEAIKNISFKDATNILLAGNDAATNYLKQTTSEALYQQINPVVQESLAKVGADKVWQNIFQSYNQLPLVNPVDVDLTNYVTQETLNGVFNMLAVEELEIRQNLPGARSNNLLKEVFAIQDNTTKTSNTQVSNKSEENKKEKTKSLKSLFDKILKN